jgi:hypothetical protein
MSILKRREPSWLGLCQRGASKESSAHDIRPVKWAGYPDRNQSRDLWTIYEVLYAKHNQRAGEYDVQNAEPSRARTPPRSPLSLPVPSIKRKIRCSREPAHYWRCCAPLSRVSDCWLTCFDPCYCFQAIQKRTQSQYPLIVPLYDHFSLRSQHLAQSPDCPRNFSGRRTSKSENKALAGRLS